MPTTTKLGGVFNTDIDGNLTSNVYVSTENVCGLIFDTKIVGGLSAALGENQASKSFANGNVVEINVLKDCEEIGLDENVMAGLPYYHVSRFFSLTGGTGRLFVSFMDSSTDTNFEAVENMQLASGGIIYQIGVWTGEAIASASDTGDYTIGDNSILTRLETVAETLGGKVGVINYDGNAPVNILVNAPIVNAATCDYKKLPDLTSLNAPKVSVILGQASNDTVHDLQLAINNVTDTGNYAVVGNIGAALACLAVAPANESIAHVANYNLSSIMTECELGFGDLTQSNKAWGTSVSWTNIKTLGYTKRNQYLHQKGYIFLTNYDGLENGVFFSSDQTLSTGDYRTIARCRVMHKSRRVVRRALLPYVNSNVEVDTSTGYMSASDITMFQNTVLEALDANMVEPGTTKPQISGRSCSIDDEQDILTNDELLINYSLVPLGVTSFISVTEGFTRVTSEA